MPGAVDLMVGIAIRSIQYYIAQDGLFFTKTATFVVAKRSFTGIMLPPVADSTAKQVSTEFCYRMSEIRFQLIP